MLSTFGQTIGQISILTWLVIALVVGTMVFLAWQSPKSSRYEHVFQAILVLGGTFLGATLALVQSTTDRHTVAAEKAAALIKADLQTLQYHYRIYANWYGPIAQRTEGTE